MKLIMNITTCEEDTLRYQNRTDLQAFFRSYGLDGLEVLEAGADTHGIIHAEDPDHYRG